MHLLYHHPPPPSTDWCVHFNLLFELVVVLTAAGLSLCLDLKGVPQAFGSSETCIQKQGACAELIDS